MKIASKIIIHILVSLTLALAIAGVGIYYYLQKSYFDDAENRLKHSFKLFLFEEGKKKEELKQLAQVLQQQESLLMLIEKNNHVENEETVLDPQKRELLREASEIVASSSLYVMKIYDSQGKLLCYIDKNEQGVPTAGLVVRGRDGHPVFMKMDEQNIHQVQWPSGLQAEEQFEDSQNEVRLVASPDRLGFELVVPLSADAGKREPIGYLQLMKRFRQEDMGKISLPLGLELGYTVEGSGRVIGSEKLIEIDLGQLHRHPLEGFERYSIDLVEEKHFYVESAVQVLNDGKQMILLGAVNKEQIQDGLNRTIQMLLFVLGVAVLVVIPGGYWLAKRHIAEPISRLDRAVASVKQGQMQDLLPITDSDDEIGHLAASFNEMAMALHYREEELLSLNRSLEDRITMAIEESKGKDSIIHEQEKRAAMTELLVNISHHWRQPLNIMSITAQNLEFCADDPVEVKKAIETITTEAENLSHTLSLFGNLFKQKNLQEKIYLELVVRKTIERFCQFHQELTLESSIDIGEEMSALGSFKILEEIFTSLLDNSKEAAQRQNVLPLKIHVRAKQLTDSVELIYEDNAGGIDADVLPKIFDPYFTTQFKSRNKGLGLYLVKSLMEANLEGTIIADNTHDGARFTLWLKSTETSEERDS